MFNGIIGIYSNLEQIIKINFQEEKEALTYNKDEEELK